MHSIKQWHCFFSNSFLIGYSVSADLMYINHTAAAVAVVSFKREINEFLKQPGLFVRYSSKTKMYYTTATTCFNWDNNLV